MAFLTIVILPLPVLTIVQVISPAVGTVTLPHVLLVCTQLAGSVSVTE